MPPKEVFGEPDAEAVTCDVADRVIINNKSIHDEEDPAIDSLFLCSLPGLRSIELLCILISNSWPDCSPLTTTEIRFECSKRAAIPVLARQSLNSTGIRRGAY